MNDQPMQELTGLDSIHSYLQSCHANRLFLVADRVAWERSGAAERLTSLVRDFHAVVFDRFSPNPQLADAEAGLRLARDHACDAWMALGGGTAIDLCKLIRCFAKQPESPTEVVTKPSCIQLDPSPMIAVPTTAGTGSEATQFAVVYVQGQKHSVGHPSMRPSAVVLDARLTATMPRPLTAATGLDALSQAIESLWSVRGTEASRADAAAALELGWHHLPHAFHSPNIASREAMLRAAHLAGRAINVSQTTAPHAVSYFLTSNYGLPHGFAVAITLAPFLRFNAQLAQHPDAPHAELMASCLRTLGRVMKVETADQMAEQWTRLVDGLGGPTRLEQLGIRRDTELLAVASAVNSQRLANNPRPAAQVDLLELLREIA
jgi:alcohol dehydrogenase class IV